MAESAGRSNECMLSDSKSEERCFLLLLFSGQVTKVTSFSRLEALKVDSLVADVGNGREDGQLVERDRGVARRRRADLEREEGR